MSDPLHPACQKYFSADEQTLSSCVEASETTDILVTSAWALIWLSRQESWELKLVNQAWICCSIGVECHPLSLKGLFKELLNTVQTLRDSSEGKMIPALWLKIKRSHNGWVWWVWGFYLLLFLKLKRENFKTWVRKGQMRPSEGCVFPNLWCFLVCILIATPRSKLCLNSQIGSVMAVSIFCIYCPLLSPDSVLKPIFV